MLLYNRINSLSQEAISQATARNRQSQEHLFISEYSLVCGKGHGLLATSTGPLAKLLKATYPPNCCVE